MKKKVISACLAVAAGVGTAYAASALAQTKPEVLVKQRQAAMTLIGKYWGPLNGMAQGKVPFNADIAERNADYIATLSKMPWDGFAKNTEGTSAKTRALPAIFEKPDDFKQAAESFQSAASKLAAVEKGNQAAFVSAAKELGKTCGGCHREFRAK